MNAAQHKTVNLLKTLRSLVITHRNVFNVWPRDDQRSDSLNWTVLGTHLVSSLADSTGWGLLQLLRVLEEEGVAQARAKEQVPRLHGDHLREGGRWVVRGPRPGPRPRPTPQP